MPWSFSIPVTSSAEDRAAQTLMSASTKNAEQRRPSASTGFEAVIVFSAISWASFA
jgi:hypothetical protein